MNEPRGASARNANSNPTPAMLEARFKKGTTLNPGGRPKGIERQLRELLKDDWNAMHEAMRDIVLGRMPPGLTAEASVKIRDRIDAYKALCDRGWGKARAVVDVTHDVVDSTQVDVDSMDVDELERFERALNRALDEVKPRALPDPNIIDVEVVEK